MKIQIQLPTRKLLALAIASLAIAGAMPASAALTAYRNAVLSNAPIVYYEFDETSGTAANNSGSLSANSDYNGTLTGTITLNQTSFTNGGNAFDFGGGRITFADTLGAMTEWTVEAWINVASTGISDAHLFGNDLGGWNDDVLIGMSPEGNTGGVGAGNFGVVQQGSPGSVRDHAGGTTLSINTWHHVVVTGSTTAGELSVYVDGTLAETNSSLTNGVSFGDNAYAIGAKRATGGNEFDGLIDEVAVYNRALTGTQINNNFNSITSVPEPSSVTLLGLGGLALILRRRR